MLKKERVDERLIEKIDISFALTIDMHMILSTQRWMIGNLKVWVQSRRQLVAEERKCLVMDSEKNERYNKPAAGELCSSSRALRMFIEQSHDEIYGCLKCGSGNSGGKRLAISMVEEAWLSEKKEGNVTTVGPIAAVSDNKGNEANTVKASACLVWRPKQKVLDHGNPQLELQEKRVIDNRCSRHMTRNKSYLSDYEEIDGGLPLEEIPKKVE
ncbi:hypothetical protein Tco_0451625 [Tanacetum coccineum]